MRVIGLLSWYDESPDWLVECVASAAALCDHLVAVDGPYVEFPGAADRPASPPRQANAILDTAYAFGIGCTIHAPHTVWPSEVDKRDYMFQLAMAFAEPGVDWFLRIDADEVLTDVPADTRSRLAASKRDVAAVTIWNPGGRVPGGFAGYHQPFRCLFRAVPGIRVEQAHYVVTAPGQLRRRVLAGNESVHHLEPAEQLPDVRLQHKTQQRTLHRWRQKKAYYDRIPHLEHVEPLAQRGP